MSEQPAIPASEAAAVFGVAAVDSVEALRPRPHGATVGVWRVRAGTESAILKLLRLDASPHPNWKASADPAHPRWWRREFEALAGGFLEHLQPELRAARLRHHSERGDGSLALWLEDLGSPTIWTVERIADVARLLGAAQGKARGCRFLDGLPTGFLREYLEPRRPHLAEPFRSAVDVLLDSLDRAPRAICHFDLHPANVFPLAEETAVIDWAYCGVGPLGSDPGVLASDAIADEMIPAQQAGELVAAIWDAYQDGLGDDQLAEAAARVYAVGTALRYSWFQAWLEGTYGPQMPESRRPYVAAAHGAFVERALPYL